MIYLARVRKICLLYRNHSAIISPVRIYALTAGALSRFFFSATTSSHKAEEPPGHTRLATESV